MSSYTKSTRNGTDNHAKDPLLIIYGRRWTVQSYDCVRDGVRLIPVGDILIGVNPAASDTGPGKSRGPCDRRRPSHFYALGHQFAENVLEEI